MKMVERRNLLVMRVTQTIVTSVVRFHRHLVPSHSLPEIAADAAY